MIRSQRELHNGSIHVRATCIYFNVLLLILTFPGANVNQTSATNRTLWPLTGGSLSLDLHHPWTYLFVNLGLGTDYPTFNITLTQQLLNETGNGTLCMPHIVLPASYTPSDGQNASIQVVTVGNSGSALYNVSDPSMVSTPPYLHGCYLYISFLSLSDKELNPYVGNLALLTLRSVCRYNLQ